MANLDFITKEGMIYLQKRIQDLNDIRPSIIIRVQVAREQGDLSENAEYKAGKDELRMVDKEIDYLNRRSAKVMVLDPETIPKDKVRFGAFVRVVEISNNIETLYRLVGVDEVNFLEEGCNKISVASPIGLGMTGKEIGQIAIAKTPRGLREFKILEIY
ncbi:MAG: GreA/GreB family elongation factor [Candidatus Zophobacter franzmannii]|jgi:transcription elongation factor GreA|nr:GreA/GreB family elongation factor [Candidatus Zophobacter franzmannii]